MMTMKVMMIELRAMYMRVVYFWRPLYVFDVSQSPYICCDGCTYRETKVEECYA
jgi:hypothetical protein